MQYLIGQSGRLLSSAEDGYFIDEAQRQRLEPEAIYPVAPDVGLLVLPGTEAPALAPLELRAQLSLAAEAETDAHYELLSRAAQLAVWHEQHRFCGRCGHPLGMHEQDLAKHCSQCSLTVYPRISPCVIVLVVRGEQALLAHNPRFPSGRYSTLAGFIEAGESAERAVAREIREEVGIEVSDIRYFRSQPWPFPHSLMFGYFARYAGGELTPDGIEIADARWFDRDALPELPPPFTISRQLIEAWRRGEV